MNDQSRESKRQENLSKDERKETYESPTITELGSVSDLTAETLSFNVY